MSEVHPRMVREKRTVEAMIGLYCRAQHGAGHGLCAGCAALADYAWLRLQKCPFQQGKTTCAKCPVHCYRPEKRQQIRAVMRYAGPRMVLRHPRLALLHLLDGLKKSPLPPEKAGQLDAERVGQAEKAAQVRHKGG
jgi:hypothetical protein